MYRDYRAATGDETPAVIASTASPYKFSKTVLAAVAPDVQAKDEFAMVDALHEKTGFPCPQQLLELKNKTVRFTDICTCDTMEDAVLKAML